MIPSTRLRDAALTAADSGLFVFPCVPRGKVPAVREWEHVATRDPEQIRQWWDHPAPPWNIGAAVGRSGIVVIDLDTAGEEPAPEPFAGATGGADVLARLAASAGQPIPITWTVGTPSGGSHLYFYAPRGHELRNTAGVLGWKIDTRANGGFVVAAGSVSDQGMYRVTDSTAIAELPAWLGGALAPRPAPAARETAGHISNARAGAYIQAIVDGETLAVANAHTGTRHRVRLKAARILGELVGSGELDYQSAAQALRDAARRHIGRDCTEHEVENDIRDGLAYGRQRPRPIGRHRT